MTSVSQVVFQSYSAVLILSLRLASGSGWNRGPTPIEHDFAGVAGFHELDSFAKLAEREAVGDDRGDVEAGLDERGHLVPGFVHLAAINSFDSELIKDDQVPIDRGAAGHDAEQRDFAAVKHVRQDVDESFRAAGHFESDVESFFHSELLYPVGEF